MLHSPWYKDGQKFPISDREGNALLRAPVRGLAMPTHLPVLSLNRVPSLGGAPPTLEVRQSVFCTPRCPLGSKLHTSVPSGPPASSPASDLTLDAASKPTSEKPVIPCQALDTSHGKPSSGHLPGERRETTLEAPLAGEISERGRVSLGCCRTRRTWSGRCHMAGDDILSTLMLCLLAGLILLLQTKSLKSSFLSRARQLQRAYFWLRKF